MKEYINQVDGTYRITGTRVSLDSVVFCWLEGQSPETIRENFPVLTLEEVYGAITFYLSNQAIIDEYLRQNQMEFEKARQSSIDEMRRNAPQLYERLIECKRQKAPANRVFFSSHKICQSEPRSRRL